MEIDQDIIRKVRPFTFGKKAIMFANRMNPYLQENLEQSLGLKLSWCVIDNLRRVSAQADSVAQGKYDFVIGQTSFLSHKAEILIAQAAKKARVPYVRANNARPILCAMAIARDANLDLDHPPEIFEEEDKEANFVPAIPKFQSPAFSPIFPSPIIENENKQQENHLMQSLPKDIGAEVLRIVDGKNDILMLDILEALHAPIQKDASGRVTNFSMLSQWMNKIGQALKELDYIQINKAINGKNNRIWRKKELIQQTRIAKFEKMLGKKPKYKENLISLTQFLKAFKIYIQDRAEVDPQAFLEEIGIKTPSQDVRLFMGYTKAMGEILRKKKYYPSSRENHGIKRRTWISRVAALSPIEQPPPKIRVRSAGPTGDVSAEINAIKLIFETLNSLDSDARTRIIRYIQDRFN